MIFLIFSRQTSIFEHLFLGGGVRHRGVYEQLIRRAEEETIEELTCLFVYLFIYLFIYLCLFVWRRGVPARQNIYLLAAKHDGII